MFADDRRVRIVPLGENRGFVDAMNCVLPAARGEWIVMLHPDVELREGCIARLTEFMREHPEAGVVSPDLYYPNGKACRLRLRFPTVRSEWLRLRSMITHILFKRSGPSGELFWARDKDTNAEMVMSVCMFFRREALEAIGPIDSRLVFYYSNDYLCHRLREHAWTCHYVLGAQAVHFERYAPKEMYSQDDVMAYKRSTIAANPRMRADYFAFLSLCYDAGARLALRAIAVAEDAIQLLAQMRNPVRGKAQIRLLWESIRVDLGL
jgi:GT2 family glycosyltransferase